MIIVKSPAEISSLTHSYRKGGMKIGLVPTMGALHAGHCSLIARSHYRMGVTVVSIFVNPAQFGPSEDFGRYPRTPEEDCARAEAAGCDVVFMPEPADMYPDPYRTYVSVDELSQRLCGVSRPNHFRGVATVVLKLFNIIQPHTAFFGQKDAQQVIVLKRMVEDLNLPVTIATCPTVRERDGLAMSSRNRYLTPAERAAAPVIRRGLAAAVSLWERGERSTARLKGAVEETIGGEPLIKKEYVEIVDTLTLAPLTAVAAGALIAAAFRTTESGTRLIDNEIIGGETL